MNSKSILTTFAVTTAGILLFSFVYPVESRSSGIGSHPRENEATEGLDPKFFNNGQLNPWNNSGLQNANDLANNWNQNANDVANNALDAAQGMATWLIVIVVVSILVVIGCCIGIALCVFGCCRR